MMTTKDWLTRETAIGCKLPCGATVTEALRRGNGYIAVRFDRRPVNGEWQRGTYDFLPSGQHYASILPNLIPPTPQPGVLVTREALRKALESAGFEHAFARGGEARAIDVVADALGLPPEPPKLAPWEAAYEARYGEPGAAGDARNTWRVAVEWATEAACKPSGMFHTDEIRRRIMGDA